MTSMRRAALFVASTAFAAWRRWRIGCGLRALALSFALIAVCSSAPGLANGPGAPAAVPPAAAPSTASPSAGASDSVGKASIGEEPKIYLAWNAPYGSPRARDNIEVACGDTTRRDTLYVSFDPGRDLEKFYGMSVTLRFHAAEGDTLGPLWWFGGGESNPRNIRILFPVEPGWPCRGPWKVQGVGVPSYARTPEGGLLDVMYAVNSDSAKALPRDRYCFARIVFPRPTRDMANCRQPICIECVQSEIGYEVGAPAALAGIGGSRFAGWNSPGTEVCAKYRASRKVAPWRPRLPGGSGR